MTARLTDELRNEVAAHPGEPVLVVDDASAAKYFLVSEARLMHLEAIAGEESKATLSKLQGLIAEADASPEIEADDFRRQVNNMIEERRTSAS